VIYYNQEREVRKMNKEFWGIITGLVTLFGLLIIMMLWAGGVI
jgi:hypothetical protein